MKIKKCVVCGNEFDAYRYNQICCSDECRKVHAREYARSNYKKKPKAAAKVKKDYSKIDAEIQAFESTWGEYSVLKEQGLWEDFKRKKFREICERNNNDIISEVSWIGGCNKANYGQAKVKGYYWQKLTDCKEIKV